MQSRQLRLGDILDDYCPRERRLTNHAVVAMIGEQVKQTRCTTCEAEHDYKHGKVPPQRKKKDSAAGLYQDVLSGLGKKPLASPPGQIVPVAPVSIETAPVDEPVPEPPVEQAAPVDGAAEDDGPVHRPLIRATLPRPEGQQPTRPAPEFTMRQPTGRPGRFRPGGANRHPHRPNRPQGHSSQPAGNNFRSGRQGSFGHPMDRSGPMSSHGGNRPGQPHRPMRHGAGSMARSGKKRSK